MKTVPFYIFDSNELLTLANHTVKTIDASKTDDNFVIQVINQIKVLCKKFTEVLGRARKSEHTEKLVAADKKRDKTYVGFRDYVFAFINSSDMDKAQAASKLSTIFETIGISIFRLSYAKESAMLNTLFNELDKPEAKQALEKINAAEWLATLKDDQGVFESVFQDKVMKSAEQDIPLLIDASKELRFYLNTLIGYIDANSVINPDKYRSVADEIDAVVTSITTTARARQTRRENGQKEVEILGSSGENLQ